MTFTALALVLGASASLVVVRALLPSDGAPRRDGDTFVGAGVQVDPAGAVGASLRDNDVILAVEGVPLDRWLDRPAPPRPSLEDGDSLTYRLRRDGRVRDVEVPMGPAPLRGLAAEVAAGFAVSVTVLALGLFVFARRPRAMAAQALALLGASLAGALAFGRFGWGVSDLVAYPALFWFAFLGQGSFFVLVAALAHFAVAFPEPLPVIRRHPWMVAPLYGLPLGWLAFGAADGVIRGASLQRLSGLADSGGLFALAVVAIALGSLARNVVLHRRDDTQRRRLALLGLGLGATLALFLVANHVPAVADAPRSQDLVAFLAFVPLPAAAAVAVLRREFLDADLAVNRSLLFGSLTVLLLGVYAAVVAALATMVGTTEFAATLPATGTVAVLFAPLRDRLQRSIDRLMYGHRRDPLRIFSALGERLEAALNPEAIPAAIVDTVAVTLSLPYAGIEIELPEGAALAYEIGAQPTEVVRFPIVHQGVRLGALMVAPRPGEDRLGEPESALLADVARHAGVAVHAVRLVTELTAARQGVMTAREAERHRLYRDLHDGLGPQLVGVALQLDGATDLAQDERLRTLLAHLREEMDAALTDVRRLVRGLRPAALDELGLGPALRAACVRLLGAVDGRPGPTIDVHLPIHLPSMPGQVELAVYQICLEAVTNAVRHSEATRCRVRLGVTGDREAVQIEVRDDGRGMDPTTESGFGLPSMAGRAEEVGGRLVVESPEEGGTRVLATLPLGGSR